MSSYIEWGDEMMHILVYGVGADKIGGIETFLFNMNKFISDDIKFDYIIEGKETIHKETINSMGGEIFFIAPKRKIFCNLNDWKRLLKSCEPCSSIVYFNMYSLAWSLPIFISKKYGYKTIVHAHNNDLHNCGIIQKKLHNVNRWLLKYLDIIRLTNSKLSSKFFFGSKKAEMIYNAIEINRFQYNENIRIAMRKDYHLTGKHVYGFVGRIAFQKNPFFLMKIFSEIQKIDALAEFLVCGDGELLEKTKELAYELELKIHFIGTQKNIQNYYQVMDAFVLPSKFEGLGIVLIEAQAAGLPCIASADVVPRVAGVTELLQYVSLDKAASEWAKVCYAQMDRQPYDRGLYSDMIRDTRFNIEKEVMFLAEQFLKEKN